jgi:MFS family permease
MPVWIEQFGIKKYKTLLLTIVYMVTSYGRIVGAWIGTVIFNNEWKKAFFCCGIIFLTLSFGLFIIPQKYYSTKYMIVEHQKKYTGNIIEKLVPTKNTEIEMKKEIENINDIEYINDDNNTLTKNKKGFQEYEEDKNIEEKIGDKNTKLLYDYDKNEGNMKKLSIFSKLRIILLNKCFFFSSLTRACLFFSFRIIHVYLKKYTFEVLNYNNEITFFYYYSLTTILAPSLGSLIGGAICNKYLGGYESKRSIWLILFFGTIAGIFISLVRISNDFKSLIFNIFGYFFSVSAFLPTISGYIINSLHKELKGFGSSFDSLITNILGKLPSPIIYGMMNDKYRDKEPKFAWNKSLMIYYIGIIFIYLACLFKWKLKNTKNKILKKNDVVEQTLKDYNLNRSNLIKPEKPIPEYNKNIKPVELEYIDKDSSYSINEINNNNKKKILNQSKKEENEEKENSEIKVNKSITQK